MHELVKVNVLWWI